MNDDDEMKTEMKKKMKILEIFGIVE